MAPPLFGQQKRMSRETFIGIVAEQGSTKSDWNGLFKYDHVKGYRGSILSTTYRPEVGKDILSIPKELDRAVLYCVLDGSQFGTAVWPELRGAQLKNFVAEIRELRIKTLIRGVHIGSAERHIKQIKVDSPILAQLFGLRAFEETIQRSPSYKVTIESISRPEAEFSCAIGKVFVGVSGLYLPSLNRPAPTLKAKSYLRLEAHFDVIEAIRAVRKIEHLLSLLTFDFIKATAVDFAIASQDAQGNWSEHSFPVERARINKKAKIRLKAHEIPLRLNEAPFADILDRFFEVFDRIEQTLSWYRVVTAEERYLEDRFFYCVRMIEALYKVLPIHLSADKSALSEIKTILDVLSVSEKNRSSVEFLQKRAIPIFSKPSLLEIISDIRARYAELKVVDILDHRIINRLRGKEAHGSSEPLSAREYQFMAHSSEILRIVYVLIVLEYCGISRSFLFQHLNTSLKFQYLFSEETARQFRASI